MLQQECMLKMSALEASNKYIESCKIVLVIDGIPFICNIANDLEQV